jgi:hypothetical protein
VTSFEKKFLASVEEQLLATSDESRLPHPTYERMKDTLSHLCYHYGRLPGGENLRNSWQKVKASDEPQDVSWLSNHVEAYVFLISSRVIVGLPLPRESSGILARGSATETVYQSLVSKPIAKFGDESAERNPGTFSSYR